MASITVRNLDDEVKHKLRIRAAEHGCSMEAEAREILTEAVKSEPVPAPPKYKSDLVRRIRAIVDPVGGIELELPKRSSGSRMPSKFE